MQFEYYVLNYDHNKQKVESFNIFRNIYVQECTEKAIKKYIRNPKKFTYKSFDGQEIIYGFDALVKEIDSIIRWQEWGRSEYEMSCGYKFETDCNKLQATDCYEQCKSNMGLITREVIWQYKQQKKKDGNNK